MLRIDLFSAQLGRWIGGMWVQNSWVWAAQGTQIESTFYNPFASDFKNISTQSESTWMCLYMNPSSE